MERQEGNRENPNQGKGGGQVQGQSLGTGPKNIPSPILLLSSPPVITSFFPQAFYFNTHTLCPKFILSEASGNRPKLQTVSKRRTRWLGNRKRCSTSQITQNQPFQQQEETLEGFYTEGVPQNTLKMNVSLIWNFTAGYTSVLTLKIRFLKWQCSKEKKYS